RDQIRHRKGQNRPKPPPPKNPRSMTKTPVKVVDKSYLQKKAHPRSAKPMIDAIVSHPRIQLNAEQERAFRIIANHAVNPFSDQLKMYIGGMGGTGKTQVLKAVIEFFSQRNESHRFVVVAPTNSAAALLAGNTYHYTFGFDKSGNDLPAKKL